MRLSSGISERACTVIWTSVFVSFCLLTSICRKAGPAVGEMSVCVGAWPGSESVCVSRSATPQMKEPRKYLSRIVRGMHSSFISHLGPIAKKVLLLLLLLNAPRVMVFCCSAYWEQRCLSWESLHWLRHFRS